jgi:phosphatidylglycerophosphatase A
MKGRVEKRSPSGILDYTALALTTWGVGYIPGAPGTYGSAIGLAAYVGISSVEAPAFEHGPSFITAAHYALNAVMLVGFCLLGIWASDRSEPIFGNGDPSQAVVDEVMGQLITFCFIPLTLDWRLILAGFVLFRFFDIVKPFPSNRLQDIPGGLGICADDVVAGVYAGVCLAIVQAFILIS